MLLPNGKTYTGVEHFDLNQLDTVFEDVYFSYPLVTPNTAEAVEVYNDWNGSSFVYAITEMLAKVGNSEHRAVRSAEAMEYLFKSFTITGINFLGCYMKSSEIPSTYVDQIEHIVFVFEFADRV